MYQSFPQRHISKSANAMPVFKQNFPEEEKKEAESIEDEKAEIAVVKKENEHNNENEKNPLTDLLGNLNPDDIIIIGIILLLIHEGSEDWLTIGLLSAILLF